MTGTKKKCNFREKWYSPHLRQVDNYGNTGPTSRESVDNSSMRYTDNITWIEAGGQ